MSNIAFICFSFILAQNSTMENYDWSTDWNKCSAKKRFFQGTGPMLVLGYHKDGGHYLSIINTPTSTYFRTASAPYPEKVVFKVDKNFFTLSIDFRKVKEVINGDCYTKVITFMTPQNRDVFEAIANGRHIKYEYILNKAFIFEGKEYPASKKKYKYKMGVISREDFKLVWDLYLSKTREGKLTTLKPMDSCREDLEEYY